MSLDVSLKMPPCECCGRSSEYVFDSNITHNLTGMADAAGIYTALWRPEETGITTAEQLIPYLEDGLKDLALRATYYKQFDAENGWGTYEQFVPFVQEYLGACRKYPKATIEVSR